MCIRDRGYWNDWMNSLYYITNEKLFSIQAILNTIITNIQFLTSGQSAAASNVDLSPVSYTHLDVYKRQVSF